MTTHYLRVNAETYPLDIPEGESLADLLALLTEQGIEAVEVPEPAVASVPLDLPPKIRRVLTIERTIPKPRNPLATIYCMAAAVGIPMPRLPQPKPARPANPEAIAKAEAKRQRRAKKRVGE